MDITDYLIDGALVLLVLLQIKERPVTNRQLIRPLIIVSVAIFHYLDGIPTGGNDLVLVGGLAALGTVIGIASGQAMIMRRGATGEVLGRAGWLSGFFWVLGMGSRFAFVIWLTHSGAGPIRHFSAEHAITSQEAWTLALLAMAVAEVCGRTVVVFLRRQALRGTAALAPATT